MWCSMASGLALLGSPSALKMQVGWVLASAVHLGHTSHGWTNLCHMSTISEENLKVDDILRKFWEIEDHNVKQPALSIDDHTEVDHFNKTHHRDERGKICCAFTYEARTHYSQ